MFGTTYASYVTKMDTCQKNVWIGSIIKEDLVKESTRESTRKESDSRKDAIVKVAFISLCFHSMNLTQVT